MKDLLKLVWRCVKSFSLRKRNVHVSPRARFNGQTVFEGNNVVYAKAIVGYSLIGRNTYIGPNTDLENCKIGKFCSISSDVKVISATHPSTIFVSSSPSFYSMSMQNGQAFVERNKFDEKMSVDGFNAIIGNDVWIGTHVLIKGGVIIGDGAIIAMGSVVTQNVPPFSIVGGSPAHVIKYRFSPEQIDRLIELKWWNKTDDWLRFHAEDFENIEVLLNNI